MKIIAGYARNVTLAPPADDGGVRPTIGRAREALFSSLGDLSGARVADLFSGSGALGLEAASRGAAQVLLVELDRRNLGVIAENVRRVKAAGAPGEIAVASADATDPGAYANGRSFDLVLADPPYAESFASFERLARCGGGFFAAFPGAQVVWELPDTPGAAGAFIELAEGSGANWELRKFGGTEFLWLKN